jgi:PTS system mannose-specific IIA component
MFGILVVSHDQLAEQLVKAARNILGEKLVHIHHISIGWEQDLDVAREKIGDALDKVAINDRAVILTDMFGGTPTNVSLTYLKENKVEVITGVNMPMLIKLAQMQLEENDINEAVCAARDRGRSTILIASEVLKGKETKVGKE